MCERVDFWLFLVMSFLGSFPEDVDKQRNIETVKVMVSVYFWTLCLLLQKTEQFSPRWSFHRRLQFPWLQTASLLKLLTAEILRLKTEQQIKKVNVYKFSRILVLYFMVFLLCAERVNVENRYHVQRIVQGCLQRNSEINLT